MRYWKVVNFRVTFDEEKTQLIMIVEPGTMVRAWSMVAEEVENLEAMGVIGDVWKIEITSRE